MNDLEIELCQPIEEHARQILLWRNDPGALSMFFHRTSKGWEDFWREYRQRYFATPDAPALFVTEGANRVAFVRFETAEPPLLADKSHPRACYAISINVAPDRRGRGLGARALRRVTAFLRERSIDAVVAEIRLENEASMGAFERAGYRLIGDSSKLIPDTGERCAIRTYLLLLRDSPEEAAAP
jgi:RimJ/RimL family protein N-acetyltransferase